MTLPGPFPAGGEALWRQARDYLGGEPAVLERSSFHTATAVWRLTGPTERALYLKRPNGAQAYRRELRAYLEWLPKLAVVLEPHEIRLPELLGWVEPPEPALLLTAVAGQTVATCLPAPLKAHEAAGRFLAALHGLPYCDRDLDLVSAYRKRLEGSRRQAREQGVQETLEPHFTRLEDLLPTLDGERRVLCHRDFTPRNWLWQAEEGVLGVIDFEHARADLRWSDFGRLQSQVWGENPASEEAFWRGYGGVPSPPQLRLVRALAAFATCGQILWAVRRGSAGADWAERGWRALRALS